MKEKTQAQKPSLGHPRNIHTKEKKDAALKGGATLKSLGHRGKFGKEI